MRVKKLIHVINYTWCGHLHGLHSSTIHAAFGALTVHQNDIYKILNNQEQSIENTKEVMCELIPVIEIVDAVYMQVFLTLVIAQIADHLHKRIDPFTHQ